MIASRLLPTGHTWTEETVRRLVLWYNKDVAVSFQNSFSSLRHPYRNSSQTASQKIIATLFFSSVSCSQFGNSRTCSRKRERKKEEDKVYFWVAWCGWKQNTQKTGWERMKTVISSSRWPCRAVHNFPLIEKTKKHSRSEEEALDSEKRSLTFFFILGGKKESRKENAPQDSSSLSLSRFLIDPCGDSCLNLILTRLLAAYITPSSISSSSSLWLSNWIE